MKIVTLHNRVYAPLLSNNFIYKYFFLKYLYFFIFLLFFQPFLFLFFFCWFYFFVFSAAFKVFKVSLMLAVVFVFAPSIVRSRSLTHTQTHVTLTQRTYVFSFRFRTFPLAFSLIITIICFPIYLCVSPCSCFFRFIFFDCVANLSLLLVVVVAAAGGVVVVLFVVVCPR